MPIDLFFNRIFIMYIWTSQSKMITWLNIKSSLSWHVQEGHAPPYSGATISSGPSSGPRHQRVRHRPAVDQASHSHPNITMGRSSPGGNQMCCQRLLKWFKICKSIKELFEELDIESAVATIEEKKRKTDDFIQLSFLWTSVAREPDPLFAHNSYKYNCYASRAPEDEKWK